MKKIGFVLMLVLTLALFCSCGGYIKNYSATVFITSCQGDEASMEFDTFKGTYNFKLRGDSAAKHTLDLEATLAEGEINVYIGVDGEKELLRTVKGGEAYDETITLNDKYNNKKTIYVILESTGKCVDGDFEFEYNTAKTEQGIASAPLLSCFTASGESLPKPDLEISQKQADFIIKVWDEAVWEDDITKTDYDYVFRAENIEVRYCYDLGLFNDVQNNRHVFLNDDIKAQVNATVDKFIVLPVID